MQEKIPRRPDLISFFSSSKKQNRTSHDRCSIFSPPQQFELPVSFGDEVLEKDHGPDIGSSLPVESSSVRAMGGGCQMMENIFLVVLRFLLEL